MRSRRSFVRCGTTALLAATIRSTYSQARSAPPRPIWLPIIQGAPPAPIVDLVPNDAPLLGPPSGTAAQAIAYLARRAVGYTTYDITSIVSAYQQLGEPVGVDWFLALAQMAHETGSLTSWWSQRPRRNPAGIGVTGRVLVGTPDAPPPGDWAWHNNQWEEGVSFATWTDDGIPAQLGRLLAYALRDEQMTDAQRALSAKALSYRAMPSSLRGIAPTIVGLNERWAWPGTNYGQMIIELMQRMQAGK